MKEDNQQCQYHCENGGWLPTDGELDAEYVVTDDDYNYLELPLLIPTQWTLCPCSDTGNLPEGVVV